MLNGLLELLPHAPTVVFLVAAFFLPGLLVLLPLRTGLPAAIALSPAVTLLIFLAGSIVADTAGVPWNPATAALAAVPPVLAAWLAGRRFSFRTPLWPGNLGLPAKLAVGAGVVFGSLVTCLALLRGIGDPATASQGWDPIFHLNVLTWIQESGSASPWGVASIFGASRSTYYPAGWHSAVSLVPGGVTEAANLSSIVIGGMIWPVGLMFLALCGPSAAPCGMGADAGVRSFVRQLSFLPAAPQRPMAQGSPPPWFGHARRRRPATAARNFHGAGRNAGPGTRPSGGCSGRSPRRLCRRAPECGFCHRRGHPPLRGSQPAAAHGAGRTPPPLACGRRGRSWVAAAVAASSVLANSRLLTGVMAYTRAVRAQVPDSLNLAFFDLPRFPALSPPAPDDFNLAVGLLVIVGAAVAVFIREARPLAISWLAFAALYVLAAGPENALRWLTGFWYKDTQRIAPFIAMTGSLLAALAVAVLAKAANRAVSARLPSARTGGRWPLSRDPRSPVRCSHGLWNLLGLRELPLGGAGGSGRTELRGVGQAWNRRPLQWRTRIHRAGGCEATGRCSGDR